MCLVSVSRLTLLSLKLKPQLSSSQERWDPYAYQVGSVMYYANNPSFNLFVAKDFNDLDQPAFIAGWGMLYEKDMQRVKFKTY